ncbi:MAG: xylulokinase [bacterium]|nr:xylulokinase [bacterium]
MEYVIGIDIGTTGVKTLLCNSKGKIISSALVEYPLSHPKPGWAEQDPSDWWMATIESIRSVLNKTNINKKDIKAVGLTGQMHGAVFLDSNNDVLRPAILWCDQRTSSECDDINRIIGKENLIALTSNPALTGFTAPKILWVRKNELHIYEKTKKILLPKDYIRFRLTGEFASDVSDASGTLLFDVKNRKWSDEVLEKLNIDRNLLPEVYESTEITGTLTKDASELIGLSTETVVIAGAGDQAAGAVGNGIVEPGIISSTIGTSGVVFAYTDQVKTDPSGRVHTFCHAVPGKWHVMGVMLAAGGSFKWLKEMLGSGSYQLMTEQASKAPTGSEGLIFLPYLMGERTPHADPDAKAVFFGISPRHTRAHIIRSVMEGVSFALRDSLEIIKGLNIPVSEIRASGGGAKSKLWKQIQADVNKEPIYTINVDEGPAFGAALLAMVGAEIYSSVPEACRHTIKTIDKIEPVTKNAKIYDEYYKLYKRLYSSLKDNFKQCSELIRQGTKN